MTDDIRTTFRALRSTAGFWSLRVVEEEREYLAVRQDTVEPPHLSWDRGAMLVAVSDGGYGYCATSDLSPAGLQAALDRATAWAEATRTTSVHRFEPRDMPHPRGERVAGSRSTTLSKSEIYDLLADECRSAKIDDRIVERYAGLELRRVDQHYLTNGGGDVRQQFVYTVPTASVTANEALETQTRSFLDARQGGFERIADSGFSGCGRTLAVEALQLLEAPDCPSGRMDLILMPDQMMLQIHESIGHPLELDRILGDERNYAGTSFVTPDMFGAYRYGSELLNVTFDPTIADEVASYGFDDEGAAAEKVWLIRNGILERPLGGELSQRRAGLPGAANSRAGAWNRAPIDRMANLNVEAGPHSLDAMIGSMKRGVVVRSNRSWSIDDSRNKFQFGCEWGELVEDGKVVSVVKNPNYRGVSAEFWRSLGMLGRRETFEVHGTLYCGKGEPNQVIHVGHAAPPALFRDVEVFGGA